MFPVFSLCTYFVGELTQNFVMNLPVCNGGSNEWCYYRVTQENVPHTCTLRKGRTYTVQLTSNNEVLLVSFKLSGI